MRPAGIIVQFVTDKGRGRDAIFIDMNALEKKKNSQYFLL